MRPVPVASADELTPDWLTDAIGSAGVTGTVTGVECVPIGTGQMSGSYRLRLTWSEDASPDAPRTLVAKLPSPDPQVSAKAGPAYVSETRFYAELAPRLPVPTARCWYAVVEEKGSTFTLLLEDCAPAEQGDQIEGCTPVEAAAAVRAIGALHAATWGDADIAALPYLAPLGASIAPGLQSVMAALVDAFVEHTEIPADDACVLHAFADRTEAWFALRAERFALLHNDFRLDNLLFHPDPHAARPVTVVDWQSFACGLPARDVAYFTCTGMEVGVRREIERELVAVYRAGLEAGGVPAAETSDVWEDYVVGLFQGPLICVLGSLNSTPTERGNEMFRVMTARTCAAIRDHDALDRL
ncbi:MAG TPA: aminoglycoside phosphotransferase family protein [Mycobacteriales bacterium]|nr:aminoglycoside phosphotransferase family protein [Mycobacteriales bacterium]